LSANRKLSWRTRGGSKVLGDLNDAVLSTLAVKPNFSLQHSVVLDAGPTVFLPFESKMVIAAKSGVQMLLLKIAASTALMAQTSGPDASQNQASGTDARQVMLPSVLATQRSLQARDHYTYVQRDEDRRLDSLGQVKSESVDVT